MLMALSLSLFLFFSLSLSLSVFVYFYFFYYYYYTVLYPLFHIIKQPLILISMLVFQFLFVQTLHSSPFCPPVMQIYYSFSLHNSIS